MKILSWNVNSIKSLRQYHPWNESTTYADLFTKFDADILCFQELKLQRSSCPEAFALAPGWDMYASFCRLPRKSGYSGVSTHTSLRSELCLVPLDAEDGFTSVAKGCASGTLSDHGRLSERFAPSELRSFDDEGRCVITDHGLFILVNVYFPNEATERLEYKMQFHNALKLRIEGWIAAGRDVVLVGDLNACHKPIDHCDPQQSIKERDINTFEETEPRQWVESLVGSKGIMVDLFRHFHLNQQGAFTCWNMRTNARPSNYGTRIDYILCTLRLVSWFKDCRHLQDWMGSDHCPVLAELHAVNPATECPLVDSIGYLHVDGVRQGDRPQRPPKIASRYWSHFQKNKLLNYFVPPTFERARDGSAEPLVQKQLTSKRHSSNTEDSKSFSEKAPPKTEASHALPEQPLPSTPRLSLNEQETKNAWRTMFTAPPPPKCYHGEPSKLLVVTKAGPNKGRQFYMCNRNIGPSETASTAQEVSLIAKDRKRSRPPVGEFQCNFFQWKKSKGDK